MLFGIGGDIFCRQGRFIDTRQRQVQLVTFGQNHLFNPLHVGLTFVAKVPHPADAQDGWVFAVDQGAQMQ